MKLWQMIGWGTSFIFVTFAVRGAVDPQTLSSGGTGRYPAEMTIEAGLPGYTVYRPADLHALGGARLPIVAWGNGGCSNVGDSAKNFLLEIASQGFLVIAVGPPGGPKAITHSAQLLDAITWATAQDGRAGGIFAGHLDAGKVAVMGHSCGGLQALEVSSDPRISTSVILDSGVLLNPPPFPMPGVVTNDKSELAKLHAPLLYVIGGPTDIAYSNAMDDFRRIDQVPVFMANINVGHHGTFAEPNGGVFGTVAGAWLRWQLKHDEVAARMFVGPHCGLCMDAAWTVEKKRID